MIHTFSDNKYINKLQYCNLYVLQGFHHAEELIKHVYVHSFTDAGLGIGGTTYFCYQCDRRYKNPCHLKVCFRQWKKKKLDKNKKLNCWLTE